MRVIALEEHFTVPGARKRHRSRCDPQPGFRPRTAPSTGPSPLELAPEIGPDRIARMDAAGIDVQVLSNTGPGPDLVPGAAGVELARAMNDHLAEAVAKHPDRFAGFAVLPMLSPDACAAELERCVKTLGFPGCPHQRHDRRALPRPSEL